MRIADGRTSFYQWDHDQMLTVPEDCTEVHFDNGTQPNALCCAVKEDGMVDVPNILLQTAAQIHAYGWNKERKCVVRYVCFWVEPREKPEDYVYTASAALSLSKKPKSPLVPSSVVNPLNSSLKSAQVFSVSLNSCAACF